jgi:hypothetical protein
MGREIQQFLVEILGSECAFLMVLGGTEESIIRYDTKPQSLQYTYKKGLQSIDKYSDALGWSFHGILVEI